MGRSGKSARIIVIAIMVQNHGVNVSRLGRFTGLLARCSDNVFFGTVTEPEAFLPSLGAFGLLRRKRCVNKFLLMN